MMKKASLPFIAFFQALGLVLYCGLIGLLMWKGNDLFGKINNLLGPTLFLVIFVFSAIICALIAMGYPFYLFWEKKDTKKALRLVGFTAGWLVLFVLMIMLLLIIF